MALSIDALKTLDRLAQRVLDLPREARAAWIAALPPEQAHLAAVLRAHLSECDSAERARAGEFMGTIPKLGREFALAAGEGAAIPEPAAGACVGPYRLGHLLGEGGMGSVWLAQRADAGMHRDVALKLPHRHLLDRGLAERVERERDILAGLSHDNIARIYDAGVDAHGRPYLALEYVVGTPIHAYCAAHAIDLAGRIRLLVQVARAVAHAHANLVVHRDLKPGNILVGVADGVAHVKLLDFGVGKILASDAPGQDLTQTIGRAFTPDYASPEQILDQPVTTAADIYSLGVVLYEVIAGEKPYTLKRDSANALADAIANADIARPSRRAAAGPYRGDAKRIAGDLDAVILKALHVDPAARYATASALADDLERFLAHRPVLAQPDRWSYRAARFARRHALALGAGAAVTCALLLGTGVALWQAQQARLEATKTRAVKDFLVNLIRSGGSQEDTIRGKRSIGEVLAESARKLPAALDEQPEVKSELQETLGALLQHMLLSEAARNVREARLRDLEARRAPLLERIQAKTDLAYSLSGTPDKKRALGLFDEVVAELDAAGDRADARVVLAFALTQRAMLRSLAAGGKGAVDDALRATRLVEAENPGTNDHVYTLIALGTAHAANDNLAAAEAAFEKALPIVARLPGSQAAGEATVRSHLARALFRYRHYGRAEIHALRALEVIEKFHGRDSFQWARNAFYPGIVQGLRGNGTRAATYLEQSARTFTAMGKDIDPEFASAAHAHLAKVLHDQGRSAEARMRAEASFAPYRDLAAPVAFAIPPIRARSVLALVLQGQGDFAQASLLLGQAVALGEAQAGAPSPELLEARRLLALNLARGGDYRAAEALLHEVIAADASRGERFGAPRDWARISLAEVLLAGNQLEPAAAQLAVLTQRLQSLDEDGRATNVLAQAQVALLSKELVRKQGARISRR